MILITGMTDPVGREVVRLLGGHKGSSVRALCKTSRERAAIDGARAGITVVTGDFGDPRSLDQAMDGVDRLLLVAGMDPVRVGLQSNAVRAAKRAGVGYVVQISTVAADLDSPIEFARGQAQTEAELQAFGIPATILRPQLLMQDLLHLMREGQMYGGLGEARIAPVDASDVAAAAVCLLTGASTAHAGRQYELSGPEAFTLGELADTIGDGLGRTVRHRDVSPRRLREQLVSAGIGADLADETVAMHRWFAAGPGSAPTDAVEQLTGHPPTSLAKFVETHRAAFLRHVPRASGDARTKRR